MRLLLDTHVALWAITNDRHLFEAARSMIADRSNPIYVSVASLWEITIKHALRRADMPISGSQAFAYFRSSGYELLDITAQHAVGVEKLPSLACRPFRSADRGASDRGTAAVDDARCDRRAL